MLPILFAGLKRNRSRFEGGALTPNAKCGAFVVIFSLWLFDPVSCSRAALSGTARIGLPHSHPVVVLPIKHEFDGLCVLAGWVWQANRFVIYRKQVASKKPLFWSCRKVFVTAVPSGSNRAFAGKAFNDVAVASSMKRNALQVFRLGELL